MIHGDDAAPVVFVCSDCGVEFRVDEGMRETLIDGGCVVCNGSVSSSNFEQRE